MRTAAVVCVAVTAMASRPPALVPFQIYTVHADGTHLTHVKNAAERYQSEPTWSRDGTHLAFVAFDGGDEPMSVYVVGADGRHVAQRTQGDVSGLTATSPTWSPSGRLAAVLAPYGAAAPSAPATLTILPATDVVAPAYAAAWSPDGKLFAYSDGKRLLVAAVDGTGSRVVTTAAAPFTDIGSPAWSPNGKRLAFVEDDTHGSSHVFVIGADGTGIADVTRNAGADMSPTWSPDGKRLALVRLTHGGRARIVVVATSGRTARVVELLPPGTRTGDVSWSARGRLAFSFADS